MKFKNMSTKRLAPRSFIGLGVLISVVIHVSVAFAVITINKLSSIYGSASQTSMPPSTSPSSTSAASNEDTKIFDIETSLELFANELETQTSTLTQDPPTVTRQHGIEFKQKFVERIPHPNNNGVLSTGDHNTRRTSTNAVGTLAGDDFSNSESSLLIGVEPITAPKPPFPIGARKMGFNGTVELAIIIGKDGSVVTAEISHSSGREDCDQSALDTIKERWKFPSSDREITRKSIKVHFKILEP